MWRTSPSRHRPVTTGARSASMASHHGIGERPGQVADGVGGSAGDVVGAGLDVGPGEGGHVGPGHVVDVDEVPGLAAVLEHLRGLPGGQGAPEDRRHPRVGRVPRHPRPVDVVVAEGDDGCPRLSAPQGAQVLLVELGGGVDVAGIERRVLVDGGPAGRAATPGHGAGRVEAAGGQVVGGAGAGAHVAVLVAPVAALAVDHHAAGQHQPAPERPSPQRLEEGGGAGVVGLHIGADVAEVDAQPDLGRLVAHRVDTVDDCRRHRRVGHVAHDEVDGGVEVVGRGRVDGRVQAVDDPHRGTRRPRAGRRRAIR